MEILWMFLQWLGLRCSKCGGRESAVSVVTELKWGSNIGDVLFEDPYYAKYRQRACIACGHTMSSVFLGIEHVDCSDVIG